ncbi:hypothetical protein GCM10023322_69710 [Rugosimonospora acidiphila]|uniref:Uncharacterized protein n=1 Tax=Rugosimonospora acidiphila TaxID=556531 RepID=A0ABP9SMK6_9ACTN
MAAPNIDPDHRNAAEVAPTDSYRPADPVWIYRGGMWRSGIVESASSRAATVTYRPAGSRGTGVDTLTARYLLARAEADPTLDRTQES